MLEDEYLVEKILDKKEVDGKLYYLVKWEGYEETESTWEPEQGLKHLKKIISHFEKNYRKKYLPTLPPIAKFVQFKSLTSKNHLPKAEASFIDDSPMNHDLSAYSYSTIEQQPSKKLKILSSEQSVPALITTPVPISPYGLSTLPKLPNLQMSPPAPPSPSPPMSEKKTSPVIPQTAIIDEKLIECLSSINSKQERIISFIENISNKMLGIQKILQKFDLTERTDISVQTDVILQIPHTEKNGDIKLTAEEKKTKEVIIGEIKEVIRNSKDRFTDIREDKSSPKVIVKDIIRLKKEQPLIRRGSFMLGDKIVKIKKGSICKNIEWEQSELVQVLESWITSQTMVKCAPKQLVKFFLGKLQGH